MLEGISSQALREGGSENPSILLGFVISSSSPLRYPTMLKQPSDQKGGILEVLEHLPTALRPVCPAHNTWLAKMLHYCTLHYCRWKSEAQR